MEKMYRQLCSYVLWSGHAQPDQGAGALYISTSTICKTELTHEHVQVLTHEHVQVLTHEHVQVNVAHVCRTAEHT